MHFIPQCLLDAKWQGLPGFQPRGKQQWNQTNAKPSVLLRRMERDTNEMDCSQDDKKRTLEVKACGGELTEIGTKKRDLTGTGSFGLGGENPFNLTEAQERR